MPFPDDSSNLRSNILGTDLRAGVHALHHNDVATAVNAIETGLLTGSLAPGVINAMSPVYGATGNGIADDTVALDAAYAAAVAASARLVLPGPYTYYRQPWALNSALVEIELQWGGTLKLKSGSNADFITVSAVGVSISGRGTIDGNHANNSTDGAAYAAIRVTAAGCTVDGGLTIRSAKRGISHTLGSRARFRSLTFDSCVRNAIFSGGDTAFDDELWDDITVINHTTDATAGELAGGCPALRLHADNAVTPQTFRGARLSNLRTECAAYNASSIGFEAWADQLTHSCKWTDVTVSNFSSKNHVWGFSADSCDVEVNNISIFEGLYGIEFAGPARGSVNNYKIDLNDRSGSRGISFSNTDNGQLTIGVGYITAAERFVDLGGSSNIKLKGLIGKATAATLKGVYITLGSNIEIDAILIGPGVGTGTAVEIEGPGTGISVSGNCDGWNYAVFAWGSSGTFDKIDVHDLTLANISAAFPLVNGFSGSAAWGASVRCHDNPGYHDCVDLLNNVLRAKGSGSPLNVVVAGIGSTFQRLDGGAATSLYVKESGAITTSTGWVAK